MKTAPGPKELALRAMRAANASRPARIKPEIKRTAKRKSTNKELQHHG